MPLVVESVDFGALNLDPVPVLGDPAGDVALKVFGEYLAAVMNDRLRLAWAALGGASKAPVRNINYNDPKDNTFSMRDLPCLYVFTSKTHSTSERTADDLWQSQRDIIALWIPDRTRQELRAKRSPFKTAVAQCIEDAIWQERRPSWMQQGEADPYSLINGTCITTAAGLWDRPTCDGADETEIDIELQEFDDDGKESKRAESWWGMKATIHIQEGAQRATSHFTPSTADNTIVDINGNVLATYTSHA